MLPGEQAKAMVDAWREGTRSVWESWVGAFAAPAPRPAPTMDQWSEAAVQGLRAWVDQGVPVASSFVERLLPDPGPLTALFEASVAAWQAVGRQVAAPPRPETVFTAVTDQLESPFRLSELGDVGQDLGDLWRLYQEALQKLSRPWVEALAGSGPLEGVAHDSGHHSGLVRFSELSWDVFERTFGRLFQSPSIGFTRELNEKLLGAFSAWLEFRRANVEYQMALSAALSRSTTKFLQELASLAGKGESIGSLRDLLRLWGDTLDGVLIESFRSEEYAKVQGRVVRAAMAYRIREREAMDVLLKIGHVPTRRDIDEVARHLYELRKEVRDIAKTAPEPGTPVPGQVRPSGAAAQQAAGQTGKSPSAAQRVPGEPGKPRAAAEGTPARATAGTTPKPKPAEAKAGIKPSAPEARSDTKPATVVEPKSQATRATAGAEAGTKPSPAQAKSQAKPKPAGVKPKPADVKPRTAEQRAPSTESGESGSNNRPPAARERDQQ